MRSLILIIIALAISYQTEYYINAINSEDAGQMYTEDTLSGTLLMAEQYRPQDTPLGSGAGAVGAAVQVFPSHLQVRFYRPQAGALY